jgi:hypothetical protein
MADIELKCSARCLVNGEVIKRGAVITKPKDEALPLLASNRFVRADSDEAKAIKPEAKPIPAKKQASSS